MSFWRSTDVVRPRVETVTFFAAALVAFLTPLTAPVALAAEFRLIQPDSYDLDRFPLANPHGIIAKRFEVVLDGDIEGGDPETLESMLRSLGDEFRADDVVLSLNSGGGSFQAGIDLARVVKEFRVATLVKKGAICRSACAVVFMAGFEALEESPPIRARYIEYPADIGFHRPTVSLAAATIPPEALAFLSKEEIAGELLVQYSEAYDVANVQIQQMLDNDPGAWPSALLARMLLMPREEFLYVRSVGDAVDWGIGIVNARPRAANIGDDVRLYYWLCHNSIPVETARGNGWWMPEPAAESAVSEDDLLGIGEAMRSPADIERSGTRLYWLETVPPDQRYDQTQRYFVMMEGLNGTGCDIEVNAEGNTAMVNGQFYNLSVPVDALRTYPRHLQLDAIVE